jgi:hypothetical protein
MSLNRPSALLLCMITVSFSLSGCASWKGSTTERTWNPSTWFKKGYQEPTSMATIWKADRMSEPGQPEQRGFGARIYFYNDKSQAIPVDGDLVVHGYLTTPSSRREQREEPDKKFSFTAEQLASQYSPSDLGASYSVWVPWDKEGFREEVTLIATFKSKKGVVVQGTPTKIHLPGKSPVPNEGFDNRPLTQQVSYKKSTMSTYDVSPSPERSGSTKITTFELPNNSQLARPAYAVTNTRNNDLESNDGLGVEVGGGGQNTTHPAFNFETLPPPPPPAIPSQRSDLPVVPAGMSATGSQPAAAAGNNPNNQFGSLNYRPNLFPPF